MAGEPLPRPLRSPDRLSDRAADNLRYIRAAMEGASRFTGVSGWGELLVGLTALLAAAVAAAQPSRTAWLTVWGVEAALAAAITIGAMTLKARRARTPLLGRPGRRFALGLTPPFVAGALLTWVFLRAGAPEALPPLWLLMYGTGIAAGGAFSIRIVPIMGLSFMATGAVGFFLPAAWGDLLLAAGFGGLHLLFGALIWRRHGG
ncbi:MAG: hypothetical protein R3325_13485 [Thermoanaerobaculia bacterium]|nr:hypothetical protein [Thermoanaerobaculia bacterium]